MKLKFNKQKIASLRITHQLLGGNTTDGGEPTTSDVSDGLPTDANACGVSRQAECTSIKNPDDCHTNDSTLKTWNPNEGSVRLTAQNC